MNVFRRNLSDCLPIIMKSRSFLLALRGFLKMQQKHFLESELILSALPAYEIKPTLASAEGASEKIVSILCNVRREDRRNFRLNLVCS